MTGIPYVVRRRQQLYLRVRIPADIAARTGKAFFTRSLQTANPRLARAEAARLLAELHGQWQTARGRNEKMKVPLPHGDISHFKFTAEDRATLQAKAETAAERAELTRRLIAMLERLVPGDPRIAAARARYQADLYGRDSSIVQSAQLHLAAQLADAVRTLKPEQARSPLAAEAKEPWSAQAEKFFADRPSVGHAARTSYEQAFRELTGLIGAKALVDVAKSDIKGFADHLRDRPINRAGQRQMSRASILKLLGNLKAYFGWAVSSGLLAVNPAEGVQPRSETREERDGKNDRRAFTRAELATLFDSALFVGCHSHSRRSKPGRNVLRDEPYWFWLISLLTGARTEEVADLPSALVDVGGITCLDFRHATKTSAGPRLIPILPDLRHLGIIEWATEQARRGRGLLQGPNAYADWSKWSNRYLDSIGLDDPALVTYSLRHNFRQQLRAANLHPEIIDKVFGHEGDSVGAGYGRDLSPEEAKLVIQKVKSPVLLDHLNQRRPIKT
ncbi:MAG TPA: DUF6538 domain-containing protein [Aliidongia sp.]|nr:DUF6538 domain-containing protein [Aliidongia sp.]